VNTKTEWRLLFEPTRVGSIAVKNRYAMGPMGPLGLATPGGGWSPRGIEYYVRRAQGGVGLIITGVCQVTNPAEHLPAGALPNPVLNPAEFLSTSRELTERVHAYGAKIVFQAGAGFGRVIVPGMVPHGSAPVAPSAIPYRWDPSVTCREMTTDEIHAVVGNFRATGALAKAAGFDGIQVHAVHEGYLLDQFAIEFYNHRTDEYGGSLENRLRFATEIASAIHAGAGDEYPVQLRYSLRSMVKDWGVGALPDEDFVERGRDTEEGIAAARMLHDAGYEVLDVDAGTYDSWFWNHPPMYQKKGLFLPFAKVLKEACPDIPLIVAGRLDDPDLAASAVRDGIVDMVSLARPLLADPDIVRKIESGHPEAVRPCLSCQEGCIGRIEHYVSLRCAVNPMTAREREYQLVAVQPRNAKRVLIVGGGLAGMEAARVLAVRGHTPVIHEKAERLGGVVIAGGQPSFKEDDLALIAWYERELQSLGVEVHLGDAVHPGDFDPQQWDHVILASGSVPNRLPVPGAERAIDACDALLEQDSLGHDVAIIGGGLTGCELGLSLRERNHNVTIVEMLDDVLEKNSPLCMANESMLHEMVHATAGIGVATKARVSAIGSSDISVDTPAGPQRVAADSVVTAIGYRPNTELVEAIRDSGIPFNVIGDARRCANIMYAIWDAFEVASHLE